MWSDNETAVDLLNVQHIVAAVLSVVRDPRLSPVTAGVFGDWGSGKSSVIKMVKAELDADPDTICVYFNGWRFEGYEDAKVALATTILEALQAEIEDERGKLRRVADKVAAPLKRLLGRVDRLRLVKALGGAGINAGVAAGGAAIVAATTGAVVTLPMLATAALASAIVQAGKVDGEAVMGLLKEQEKAEQEGHREVRQTVRDFRDDFEKLIAQLPLKRLVVVVDDLDRCLPPNVIDTFEAIRLFLSAPNTAFVITADEGVMRYAVSQRFPAYDEAAPDGSGRRKVDVGGRYLEKFVQVPVHIPPLSPGDLHGYLNMLFAEKHAADPEAFPEFCRAVREATAYDEVAFRTDDAERLLGTPPSEELKVDLVLAEQIAPVLAVSAEGNPRQTKRFLNALLLRMEMAKSRKVKLERAVAAKLLLLEYFQPAVFTSLARSAAAQGGVATELAILEAQVRPAPAPPGEDDGSNQKGPRAAAKRGSGKVSEAVMLPAYTVGLTDAPKARAWLAAEPQIGSTDLRPYIYFAAERFLVPVGDDQRLSPTGREVLWELLVESEAFHRRGAERLPTLQATEVSVIITALAQAARRSEDLGEKTSPLYALFGVAEKRGDAAAEVLRAVVNLPAESLPSSTPVRVSEIAQDEGARATAEQVLERWAQQTVNKGLQRSASGRLQALRSTLVPARAP
jgi:hypothetical protein